MGLTVTVFSVSCPDCAQGEHEVELSAKQVCIAASGHRDTETFEEPLLRHPDAASSAIKNRSKNNTELL